MVRGSCLFRNGTVRVAVVQRNKIKKEEVRVIYVKRDILVFLLCGFGGWRCEICDNLN